jgi:hypothetical protein
MGAGLRRFNSEICTFTLPCEKFLSFCNPTENRRGRAPCDNSAEQLCGAAMFLGGYAA